MVPKESVKATIEISVAGFLYQTSVSFAATVDFNSLTEVVRASTCSSIVITSSNVSKLPLSAGALSSVTSRRGEARLQLPNAELAWEVRPVTNVVLKVGLYNAKTLYVYPSLIPS